MFVSFTASPQNFFYSASWVKPFKSEWETIIFNSFKNKAD